MINRIILSKRKPDSNRIIPDGIIKNRIIRSPSAINSLSVVFNKIVKNQFTVLFVSVLIGITTGIVIIGFFSFLSLTYAVLFSAALISPFFALIMRDAKRLLWFVLIICLPITVDFTINHTGHIGGAGGYVISLFDIVLFILYLTLKLTNKLCDNL